MTLKEQIAQIVCNTIRESVGLKKVKPCSDGFGFASSYKIFKQSTSSLLQAFRGVVPEKKKGGNGIGCNCGAEYWGECCCSQNVDWSDTGSFNSAIKIIEERLDE